MKTTIRSKVNRLILMGISMLSVVMVCVNLVIIVRYTAKNSEVMMDDACEVKVAELNNQFNLVEQSVQNIYDISETIRPAIDVLRSYDKSNNYLDSIQEMAVKIADNTEGAITVYYRLNPDLNVSGTQGFFYVKSPETDAFESYEITNLLDYDTNDVEHVGWYYIPVWAGHPVWMEPYYNANIGVNMISYVIPVFDGYDLIGVVGMDVDFDRLVDITEDIHIYKSSGAVLTSMESSRIYYNTCNLLGDKLSNEMFRRFQNHDDSKHLFTERFAGQQYLICYKTLENRMKMIVYANRRNVYEQAWLILFVSIVIFFVSIMILFTIAMHMTSRLVNPIKSLAEATEQYAKGNWDATVSCNTDNELQLLADNISAMADSTKQYIKYINDMAKKDVLTGLRNKTAYTLYIEKINNEYIKDGREFAVAIFDVNHLKTVNDTYGHEKGDELIVAASKAICKQFTHSPVFRIGGDEFVSILDSDDYAVRDTLLEEFRRSMDAVKDSSDVFKICVASGMAVFGQDGETYEALFNEADRRMYQNKLELKGGNAPR